MPVKSKKGVSVARRSARQAEPAAPSRLARKLALVFFCLSLVFFLQTLYYYA